MSCSMTIQGVAVSFNSYGASLSKRPKITNISCRATTTRLHLRRRTTLYQVLSLESENAGIDEIKKAYRTMARRYHPDACPPSLKEESTRMFVDLHRAYTTLSDPVSRRSYDNELRMRGLERPVWSELSREIWEAQLKELSKRSDRREKAGSRRT